MSYKDYSVRGNVDPDSNDLGISEKSDLIIRGGVPGSSSGSNIGTAISVPTTINANTTTSSTASHQHQQEQALLSSFTIPNPPISTQQSSVAAEKEQSGGLSTGQFDPPRTLWMGDLDPWLDENGIADLWSQIIQKRVTVKIIKPKNTRLDNNYGGLSHSGYCFVEFETFDDAQQALSLNGQLLPDIAIPSQQQFPNNPDNQKKYFRLNWASGATLSAPIVQTPEFSLFVGDLSASTTEAHLLAFFQKHFPTSIKTVRVMTDPVSGKSRCFGFVRFTDEMERQRALIEMNGVWFGGRPLRVALATPRNNPRSKYPMSPNNPSNNNDFFGSDPNLQPDLMYMGPPQPNPMRGASPYGYFGSSPIPPPHFRGPPQPPQFENHGNGHGLSHEMENNADLQGGIPQIKSPLPVGNSPGQTYADPNNTTVFVGGLSSEVSEATLFTLFKPFGIIEQVKIPPGKNCGFIKYSTREEAEDAIAAMQGFIIGGNRVRLSWGRVSMNNKKFRQQQQHVAQAAQMQAAAALSLGMDPASAIAAAAAAAAGYPPPTNHGGPQLGGMPPMGIAPPPPPPPGRFYPGPPEGNPSRASQYLDKEFENTQGSDRSSSFDNSSAPGIQSPQFYMPMHPLPPGAEFNVPHGKEDFIQAMNNLNIGSGNEHDVNAEYMNPGYMVPPIYGGYPLPDMQYQQFMPGPPHIHRHQQPREDHHLQEISREEEEESQDKS